MKIPDKVTSTFDKFLIGGLGCGVFGLCILLGGFVYVWQNPPRPRPTASQTPPGFAGLATVTSTAPGLNFPTPTLFPAITPTQNGTLPATVIPSPIPQFDDSPPTGQIVFTCFINQIDQICLMNADGSERKQLTDSEGTSFYASLSPDGKTIYFASRMSGSYEIYSMNLRGRGLKRLTRNIGSLYAPELSPSGERIIFTNNTEGMQRIWIMRADGNNPHALSDGPQDIDPTWSPDGLMIAFASSRTGQRQLYVMDRDGANIRQLTNLNDMGGRSTWSPDGSKLAFYAGPTGDHNIYIINVDGTGLVQLTNGGDNLGPSWSPEGDWITFTSFRDGNNEIYIMHPDGTGVTRLTNNPTSDWQPRWGR